MELKKEGIQYLTLITRRIQSMDKKIKEHFIYWDQWKNRKHAKVECDQAQVLAIVGRCRFKL